MQRPLHPSICTAHGHIYSLSGDCKLGNKNESWGRASHNNQYKTYCCGWSNKETAALCTCEFLLLQESASWVCSSKILQRVLLKGGKTQEDNLNGARCDVLCLCCFPWSKMYLIGFILKTPNHELHRFHHQKQLQCRFLCFKGLAKKRIWSLLDARKNSIVTWKPLIPVISKHPSIRYL